MMTLAFFLMFVLHVSTHVQPCFIVCTQQGLPLQVLPHGWVKRKTIGGSWISTLTSGCCITSSDLNITCSWGQCASSTHTQTSPTHPTCCSSDECVVVFRSCACGLCVKLSTEKNGWFFLLFIESRIRGRWECVLFLSSYHTKKCVCVCVCVGVCSDCGKEN